MSKSIFFAASLLLVLLVAGCGGSDSASSSDAADAALLRVHNDSDVDFSSVMVRFPEAEAGFGAVAAGESSEYREFESAYRYGSITVEAEGETYEVRAIDYMGESPLENGRYTYELEIEEGQLEMEFEQN